MVSEPGRLLTLQATPVRVLAFLLLNIKTAGDMLVLYTPAAV